MCSIFAILELKQAADSLRTTALAMSKKMRHRGPDWSGIHCGKNAILVHERLAIVGVSSGAQPLYSQDKKLILAVNGEIYNHQELRARYQDSYQFQTDSDCEVILPLYLDKGVDCLDELNGIFAFVLYDEEQDEYLIGRDHLGIIPLYQGRDEQGQYYIASEMKALVEVCSEFSEFPTGSYYHSSHSAPQRYYQPAWQDYAAVEHNVSNKAELTDALQAAVARQLMSDVPYGVLLSGGLDSSITSAIAKRYSMESQWWPQLHSFAIGLEGAPDLAAAAKVAKAIGTVHHELTYSIQEGIDAIKDVIYHIETYDVTTIRASTPMYLMARKIKAMGIKMVISGEGADEIFGGYLYFHKAPNAKQLHEETVRKLFDLHLFDCARANKSLAAWGVEGRVPFLDKAFLDVAMTLNPQDKMCGGGKIEKHILRECFADLLPKEIVWRQKEQFSDGVGYGWIDALKAEAACHVSDEMLQNAEQRFAYNTPTSKEAYWYRDMFSALFPSAWADKCVPGGPSIACSSAAAIAWDESFKHNPDPSGRAVIQVHQHSYEA